MTALTGAAGVFAATTVAVLVGRGVTVTAILVAVAVGVTVDVAVGFIVGVCDGLGVAVEVGTGVSVGVLVTVGGNGVAEGSGEATSTTGVAVGVAQAARTINTLNKIKLRCKRFMNFSLNEWDQNGAIVDQPGGIGKQGKKRRQAWFVLPPRAHPPKWMIGTNDELHANRSTLRR